MREINELISFWDGENTVDLKLQPQPTYKIQKN